MTTFSPGPLPLPPTTLIGRAEERAALHAFLTDETTRLVTLVGPPGVGKTLLAQHLARDLAPAFAAGSAFVPLDALRDPALVPAAVARVLDVREAAGRPPAAAVAAHLAGRQLLLVLDNLEQVIDAATFITDLLAAAPGLRVLATSRTPLRLRAEQQLPLAPLSLRAGDEAAEGDIDPATVPASAAAQLFIARARAVRPDFALTAGVAADVAAICTALDGLPLALELAAARIDILSPTEIVARLGHRLALLTGGYRDLPDRHRTLRAAIDWSYDLLAPEEQALFRALGAFAGGATLDAVEAVAAPDVTGNATLDHLLGLAGQSLLRREEDGDGRSRYRMLETIREYAREQLAAAGEAEAARLRHAAYFVTLANAAIVFGPEGPRWLARLDAEHDNLHLALATALEAGRSRLALELAAALSRFWMTRGYLTEGRAWLDRTLAAAPDAPPLLRARALDGAGLLARGQGDLAAARALLDDALVLAGDAGDTTLTGDIHNNLGMVASDRADYAGARDAYGRALALRRAQDDHQAVAMSLNNLGLVAWRMGDTDAARAFHEESLALKRGLGDGRGIAASLNNLGVIAFQEGDHARARAHYEESLVLKRAAGDQRGVTASLNNLAEVAHAEGDEPAALAYLDECLALAHAAGDRWVAAIALEGLADVASASGQHERVARLLGAAEAVREAIAAPLPPASQTAYERTVEATRAVLGDLGIARAWNAGRALSFDAAVAEARATTPAAPESAAPAAPTASVTAALTAREAEVLGLLAAGESNREIADQLVVSERTVEHHIANIYRKIDARGRVDATAYALRHGIVRQ